VLSFISSRTPLEIFYICNYKLKNNSTSKHIKLKHFYIRECFHEGEVQKQHVSTQNQLADLMTKPLFKPKLTKFCEEFGLKKRDVKEVTLLVTFLYNVTSCMVLYSCWLLWLLLFLFSYILLL
jgi:hypothetical protein